MEKGNVYRLFIQIMFSTFAKINKHRKDTGISKDNLWIIFARKNLIFKCPAFNEGMEKQSCRNFCVLSFIFHSSLEITSYLKIVTHNSCHIQ